MKIKLRRKHLFNKQWYEPACKNSRELAKICKVKVFMPWQLESMRKLKWEIEFKLAKNSKLDSK